MSRKLSDIEKVTKKAKHAAYMKEWYKKHPDRNRKNVQQWRDKGKRKAERRTVSKEWREAISFFLINRDGMNCLHCGLPIDTNNFCLGHILSPFLGGNNQLENYHLVHGKCNVVDGLEIRKKLYGK